jgi:homoaconitase/3-isopropylmalate dehydratase large subunit
VAADRMVECTGPGLRYLSCDARFAIANVTTLSLLSNKGFQWANGLQEFGGITGIFVPDQTKWAFIASQKNPRSKTNAVYLQPDADASHFATHENDFSAMRPFIAKCLSLDDVVPVTEFAGTELDGGFIVACTTSNENIILDALVPEQGLAVSMKSVAKGKRKITPGSRPIVQKLEDTGLADVYRTVGFEIRIYCVSMSVNKAAEGEV